MRHILSMASEAVDHNLPKNMVRLENRKSMGALSVVTFDIKAIAVWDAAW